MNPKISRMAILMEIAPLFVQLIGIISILFVAYHDIFHSLLAIIVSILWLKLSKNKLSDEFGQLRMQRFLFVKLGEWLNQPDSKKIYQQAQEDYLMMDGEMEDNKYVEVVTAAAIVNFLRSSAAILISIYLIIYVFYKLVFPITI